MSSLKEDIDGLRKYDWQTIVDYGNSLEELNDSQWRFIKGLSIELFLEKMSNGQLTYVGEKHRDFISNISKNSIELKSQFSSTMFDKKGRLRKNYSIRLNNSQGTNKLELQESDVCDFVLVVMQDGAFTVDKKTVLNNVKYSGDGFALTVSSTLISVLTPRLVSVNIKPSNLKSVILQAIKDSFI